MMKTLRQSAVAAACILFACCTPARKGNVVVFYSQTGNTENVAMAIASRLQADTLHITPLEAYPDDFQATVDRCRAEMKDSVYPETAPLTSDLSKYDTVYLGYPIWCGTFARPVMDFLKKNAFLAGHVVVPFATYGSGGLKRSARDLEAACPEAAFAPAFGIASKRIGVLDGELEAFFSGRGQLCGGYTEQRPLENEEIRLFDSIVDPKFSLVPISVSTQVVAGLNYRFCCTDSLGNEVEVKIFSPLPGQGDPEVTSIER